MLLSDVYASGSENLKAEDLKEKDASLTVKGWSVKEFDEKNDYGDYKAKKVILSFNETDKTLVLNKTNSYAIADFLGTEDVNVWVGATIVLYKTKTNFGGKMTDCIRVRNAFKDEGVGDSPF
jgi:methyltransferase-like protein